MKRADGRAADQLRRVKLTRRAMKFAEGSCLIEWGDTTVLCSASLQEKVPPFLKGSGKGWVTAEYGMLPRATKERSEREASRGKLGGRTQEIQRLIGRSLRSVTDLAGLGERAIWVDCDVLQADGGTRCAAITGGFVALVECLLSMQKSGLLPALPVREFVAAVSIGIVDGKPLVDLAYTEDSTADVDMNLIMTGGGEFVEIQGTAERRPFSHPDLNRLLKLGAAAVEELVELQRKALGLRTFSA